MYIFLISLFLIGLSVVSILRLFAIIRKFGVRDNIFYISLVVAYLVVILLSGLVHLNTPAHYNRGYFDTLFIDRYVSEWNSIITAFVAAVGLFGLLLSSYKNNKKFHISSRVINEQISNKLLLFGAAVFLIPALVSLQVMSTYADVNSTKRIISLEDGMARFGFMAQWLPSVITMMAIYLMGRLGDRDRIKSFIVIVSVSFIFYSLQWTGGRTIAVLLSLPLLFVAFDNIKKHKLSIFIAMIFGSAFFILFKTIERFELYTDSQFSLISVLDWEFGKFSMIGFAVDYATENGLLWGETLIGGFYSIPLAVLKLIGLGDLFPIPRLVVEVTGEAILGSQSLIYIVPGGVAELYLNFGVIGVFFGMFLIGRLACHVDLIRSRSCVIYSKLFYTYFGVIIVLCTLSAQSGAFFGYLFFIGFPYLFVFFMGKILDRK